MCIPVENYFVLAPFSIVLRSLSRLMLFIVVAAASIWFSHIYFMIVCSIISHKSFIYTRCQATPDPGQNTAALHLSRKLQQGGEELVSTLGHGFSTSKTNLFNSSAIYHTFYQFVYKKVFPESLAEIFKKISFFIYSIFKYFSL